MHISLPVDTVTLTADCFIIQITSDLPKSGVNTPIWTTYERLAVEACLEQLKNHVYFVPDFSYFRVKQLQA